MLALLGLVSALAVQAPEAPEPIRLFTEENPPYTYANTETGAADGIMTTIVKELMRRADYSFTIEVMPWKRAYSLAQRNPNSCTYAMDRTPEREGLFHWITPLYEGEWVLLKIPGSPITIETLDDARPYRIVGTAGYASALALIEDGFQDVLLANTNMDAIAMLYRGRADLMVLGGYETPYVAQIAGVPTPERAYGYRKSLMSLGCNLDTDPAIIQTLQDANRDMKAFRLGLLEQQD